MKLDLLAEEFVKLRLYLSGVEYICSPISATNQDWDIIYFEENGSMITKKTVQVKSIQWKHQKTINADFQSMCQKVDFLCIVIFGREGEKDVETFKIPTCLLGPHEKGTALIQNGKLTYSKPGTGRAKQSLSLANLFSAEGKQFIEKNQFKI